jgi:hypothetical protein
MENIPVEIVICQAVQQWSNNKRLTLSLKSGIDKGGILKIAIQDTNTQI